MYMSNLDAKGFLGTDELSALLNHNALVRTTEIGTCDTGKYAVAQVLWLLQWVGTHVVFACRNRAAIHDWYFWRRHHLSVDVGVDE